MSESNEKLIEGFNEILSDLDKKIEEVSGQRMNFLVIVMGPEKASFGANCVRDVAITGMESILESWAQEQPQQEIIPPHLIN